MKWDDDASHAAALLGFLLLPLSSTSCSGVLLPAITRLCISFKARLTFLDATRNGLSYTAHHQSISPHCQPPDKERTINPNHLFTTATKQEGSRENIWTWCYLHLLRAFRIGNYNLPFIHSPLGP